MAVEDSGVSPAGEAGLKNNGDRFLAYGLSNPFVLLIGGAFLGIGMLLGKYLTGKFGTIYTGISLIPSINLVSIVINALILIIVLGYLMSCIRELAKGNYRMPSISKNLHYLGDGIGAFTILIVYSLLAILILYFAVTVQKMLIPLFCTLCILTFVMLIIGPIASILLLLSGWISLAFYANDGDFFFAVNPIVGIARALSHVSQLITVIVRMFIAGLPLIILSCLYKVVPLFEVLSPWARFYALAASAFIAYDFYRNTDVGKAIKSSKPQDPDT